MTKLIQCTRSGRISPYLFQRGGWFKMQHPSVQNHASLERNLIFTQVFRPIFFQRGGRFKMQHPITKCARP